MAKNLPNKKRRTQRGRLRFLPARSGARPHTGLWNLYYTRYRPSRLKNGIPAAHGKIRLVLLGSPPDTVHGIPLRGTGLSSLLRTVRRYSTDPGAGIHPCCSGLQVQGTANSPTSAALPHTGESHCLFILLYPRGFINNPILFFCKKHTLQNGKGVL